MFPYYSIKNQGTQYDYVERLARDLASGKQPLNAAFLRRVELYARAARAR